MRQMGSSHATRLPHRNKWNGLSGALSSHVTPVYNSNVRACKRKVFVRVYRPLSLGKMYISEGD
jgi:hypothetical protein